MLDTGWAQLDKDPEYSRVYPIGNMRVSSVPWRPRERGSAIRRMGRCGISARQWPDSFGLDVSGSDHLGPLLGFVRNEFAKVGRRACERAAT
jgi:hypothetical protein